MLIKKATFTLASGGCFFDVYVSNTISCTFHFIFHWYHLRRSWKFYCGIKRIFDTFLKNLHIVGELVDIDGDCGGYNLTFAWISGLLAGKSDNND